MDYYKESIETVLSSLNTSTEGIMTEDAKSGKKNKGLMKSVEKIDSLHSLCSLIPLKTHWLSSCLSLPSCKSY